MTEVEAAPFPDAPAGPEPCTDALCADLIGTLRRYEPATAARMTRRRVTRRPLSEYVPEIVVFGRPNSGRGTLVAALAALAEGKARYREWVSADADGQGPGVVLVVFDANNPISSADLEDLRDLGAAVDSVVFALTKTDVNQNWRQVRDRNAQLLAIHTPRFARVTIHPVATPLAQAANEQRATDPAAARLLQESAGVLALHKVLMSLAPRPGSDYGERNVLRGLAVALADAHAKRQRVARECQNTAEINNLFKVRSETARARGAGRAEELAQLRGNIQIAKVELGQVTSSWLRSAAATVRGEVDALAPAGVADYHVRLQAIIDKGEREVRDQAEARIAAVYAEHRIVPEDDAAPGQPGGAPPVSGAVSRLAPAPPVKRGAEDVVMVAVGASAGAGLGRLVASPLGLVPALDILVLPLTLLLGALAALWLIRVRRQLAARGRLREWSSEHLVDARASMERWIAARMVAVELDAGAILGRIYDTQAREADGQLREIDLRLRELTTARDKRLASLNAELAELGEAVDRAMKVLEP